MNISRQQPGKLNNSDSIPGISKGVLSNVRRPDRLLGPLSRLSRSTGRSFCCSKTTGAWFCRLLPSLRNRKQNHAP